MKWMSETSLCYQEDVWNEDREKETIAPLRVIRSFTFCYIFNFSIAWMVYERYCANELTVDGFDSLTHYLMFSEIIKDKKAKWRYGF